jgi:LAGLIDADG endonuclease
MVSHIVSVFSGKPIFGQSKDGPKYINYILKQTICRKLSILYKQITIQISHNYYIIMKASFLPRRFFKLYTTSACISAYFYDYIKIAKDSVLTNLLVWVKIFVYSYNPQITKARILLKIVAYKSNIAMNSGLSMLVGISEAIRLLFFKTSSLVTTTLTNSYFSRYRVGSVLGLGKFPNFTPVSRTREKGKVENTLSLKKSKPKKAQFINSTAIFSPSRVAYLYKEKRDSRRNLIFLLKIRKYSSLSLKTGDKLDEKSTRFNQWLAGLIDGDGCFQLSKKGYASLEIVMETRDKHCLYQIKQKFGGSVKLRSGVNFLRYRLHHRKGLLDLIKAVNGEIRNPVRLLQLNKICDKYNITIIQPDVLTYNNGWFSGLFDSDGSVYLNLLSSQLFISVSQKNRYMLDQLQKLYGGTIYIQKESFKWVVYRRSEIIELLEYFKLCPSRSAKHNRLKSVKRYHELKELKAHLAPNNSILGKAWKNFLLK